MADLISNISSLIWSTPLIILAVGTGLYFSISTRFLQVRHFKDMVILMLDNKKDKTGVSSYQALTMSIANRVGTGNIAGVATAITIGGPGAVFWMWLIAFLGAATSFAESTLAQIYKVKDGDEFRGGSSFYIEKGLGFKKLAIMFAIAMVLSKGFGSPSVQSNALTGALSNAFGISKVLVGVLCAIAVALIIFGGVKRIAKVAEIVVPFMAIGYVIVASVVIFANINDIPGIISLIFSSAFGLEASFGGILGAAIAWGVKRGIYSNEAGQGTAPPFAAAANVSHPAKQGLVQGFSVYIDTIIVCSATAFIILLTGMYNVEDGKGGYIYQGLGSNVEAGAIYAQSAVDTFLTGFGTPFIAIALLFFSFTTILGNYYAGEVHAGYLQEKMGKKWIVPILRVGVLFSIISSTFYTAKTAWALGDIGIGLMAWINFIAILLLSKIVLRTLKDYEEQKRNGLDPVFNPIKIGIKNADYWEARNELNNSNSLNELETKVITKV